VCATGALADAGRVAKSSAAEAADVLPQAAQSGSRAHRAPHPGDSPGHSCPSGSSGEAKSTVVKVIVQLIRNLVKGIADLDEKIEEAAAAHPDFFIFESLPGAGAVIAPRLLAAFGSQRERYGNAGEVQSYSGIAPVTEKSGKKKWVHFRWACPKFLRQSFHEWAGHSIAYSVWARSYYQQQRSKGQDHHAAVRALAFKWIRIVFRCWKDGVAYDESKYLASLARRGSPLAALAATAKTL